MNNHEESLKKSHEILDATLEIMAYLYDKSAELVDEKMPYAELLNECVLPSQRIAMILDREQAISTIMANALQFSERIRI